MAGSRPAADPIEPSEPPAGEMHLAIADEPWIGPDYARGLDGLKIAIVGCSRDQRVDDPEHDFFRSVRKYFGDPPVGEFWNRVAHFTLMHDGIGVQEVKTRFIDMLRETKPDKVLVFSMKAWRLLPPTAEEERGERCPVLAREFLVFSQGTFVVDGKIIGAYGFRDQPGALAFEMAASVRCALMLPVPAS